MQNPFVKLKQYRRDATDPLENHATETLAACLSFSDNIKREFIRFLFAGKMPFDTADAESFEVSTQAQLGGYGTVDLLLEVPGKYNAVIEIKVGAPEDAEQIKRYRRWLEDTKEGTKYVFSLVRTPNAELHIEACGGNGRRKWRDLYDFFSRQKKGFVEESEKKIIDCFCNYLEAEGIVSTWTPAQIVDYGKGVIARKALQTLFERVEERLLAQNTPYLATMQMPERQWPRLEVGMKSWTAIFGAKGYLQKVYVYYQTKAVWEGEAEGFYFEIVLWQKHHRHDWKMTALKLPQWIGVLKKNKFDHWTILKGARELEKDASNHNFLEPPSYICACATDRKVAYIGEVEIVKASDTELVDRVFDRTLQHCAVVSQFT
jgi:hypothetical protein